MRRRGFSLVELLFVIGIIALLAAILFPVFATARGKARQTVCASNLRQLGIAISLYAQDYDDLFPVEATRRTSEQMSGRMMRGGSIGQRHSSYLH